MKVQRFWVQGSRVLVFDFTPFLFDFSLALFQISLTSEHLNGEPLNPED